MERIIKFRAWDGEKMLTPIFMRSLLMGYNTEYAETTSGWDNWNFDYHDGTDPVVMQFTGLVDSKGVELFEGDILQPERYSKMSMYNAPIVFKDGMFMLEHKLFEKSWLGDTLAYCAKRKNALVKIGNIWENKELLDQPQQ